MEQENNKIKKSVDAIIPSQGAKERMLANIYKKAEIQQIQFEKVENKKVEVSFIDKLKANFYRNRLSICFCMMALVGLTITLNIYNRRMGPVVSPGDLQGSPYQQVETLNDLNQKLDLSIILSEQLTNQRYSIFEQSIGCVDFFWKEHEYTLMVSKEGWDFSGVDGSKINEEIIDSSLNAILTSVEGKDYDIYKLYWTNGIDNFYLLSIDESTNEWMKEIFQLINY